METLYKVRSVRHIDYLMERRDVSSSVRLTGKDVREAVIVIQLGLVGCDQSSSDIIKRVHVE